MGANGDLCGKQTVAYKLIRDIDLLSFLRSSIYGGIGGASDCQEVWYMVF